MKPLASILVALLLFASATEARSWMDKQGRIVEAEIIRVNPDRTAVLRNERGKTFTVPFDIFMDLDADHLDALLAHRGRRKLHPVLWYEMNDLFGLEIWRDVRLWGDSTAAVAERLRMRKESKTDFMENYRGYPLGRIKVLGEQMYAAALYGGKENVESLSLVFLNQGDVPLARREGIAEQIEKSGMRVHDTIVPILGKPKSDSLGTDDLREKVWRWDWNDHAIMLSLQEGKYVVLRIMPVERAERGGRIEKLGDEALKVRIASCVERRDNGDVILRNIPMVHQGPKGYCSPATWERYLRYLSIPADMYLLALASDTDANGTYIDNIIAVTRNVISSNGRKLKDIDDIPTMKNVMHYIDIGLPMMWRFISTPEFQQAANDNTARRYGKEPKKNPAGQKEDDTSGGHICLITGYNQQTAEIAISDSWGPRFAERWVPIQTVQEASYTYGGIYVIRW
jgi:hypothetical protein